MDVMREDFSELERIASASLRACFWDGKLVASPTHFSDFWARDTFWALPGLLAIGERDVARSSIAYFLSLQREDGKIPRKASRDINVVKYLIGKSIPRETPRPTYHGLVKPFYAMDSELLLIIAMERFVVNGEQSFAERHYVQLQKAMEWHITRAKDNEKYPDLLSEYFLGNWMDTVFKFGPVLYTNVLYVRALGAMADLSREIGQDAQADRYRALYKKTRRAVREQFWMGEYFADEVRVKNNGVFDLSGNVLAVLFDVADPAQKDVIVSRVLEYYREQGSCLCSVPTGHKWWKINPVVRLMGISDYHTQTSWLWISAYAAQILMENGQKEAGLKMLRDIQDMAVRDGEIGETYTQETVPYKKLLWKSATPFAWSSGVILGVLESLIEIPTNKKTTDS